MARHHGRDDRLDGEGPARCAARRLARQGLYRASTAATRQRVASRYFWLTKPSMGRFRYLGARSPFEVSFRTPTRAPPWINPKFPVEKDNVGLGYCVIVQW